MLFLIKHFCWFEWNLCYHIYNLQNNLVNWEIKMCSWCHLYILYLILHCKYGLYNSLRMVQREWFLLKDHYGKGDQKGLSRASLVAQWLRICLPIQGTRVRAKVWEDPTCRGATRPVSHNYWACASGACAPQQERPRQWEARAPRWRVAPTCHN